MPHGRLFAEGEESERVTVRLRAEHWDWLGQEAKRQWRTEPELIGSLLSDAIRARIEAKAYEEQVKSEAQKLFDAGLANR